MNDVDLQDALDNVAGEIPALIAAIVNAHRFEARRFYTDGSTASAWHETKRAAVADAKFACGHGADRCVVYADGEWAAEFYGTTPSHRPGSARSEAKAARDQAAYEKAREAMDAAGHFDPIEMGCGRCGGKLLVHAMPYHSGGGVVGTRTFGACQVCRVDRVKRWGDLIQASADDGDDPRGRDPINPPPTARALARRGLVKYDNHDGAWELTSAGLDLLRRFDAGKTARAEAWRRNVRHDALRDLRRLSL